MLPADGYSDSPAHAQAFGSYKAVSWLSDRVRFLLTAEKNEEDLRALAYRAEPDAAAALKDRIAVIARRPGDTGWPAVRPKLRSARRQPFPSPSPSSLGACGSIVRMRKRNTAGRGARDRCI